MKTFILQNIVSNNNVYTINMLIDELGLNKKKMKVLFCAETERNRNWTLQEKPRFSYEILEHKRIELSGKDLFTYFINLSIIDVLNKENPDHLIVGGWDQFAYQIAVLWGRLRGKRVTLWSGSTVNEKSWRRTISLPLVLLLVACSSDFLVYGTRAKEYLESLGASEKNILIHPNDVNREYFAKEAAKARKGREQFKKKHHIQTKKNFLYVGQLIKRKGILDLLDAYYMFSKKHSDWGLVIIGYGYLKEQINAFIQTHQLKHVQLIDGIDQYDLPRYYVSADCLILPSHEEVWGLVVNEAIACGLPAIVSNVCGCIPDICEEGDVRVFEAKNVESLQSTMEQILKKR